MVVSQQIVWRSHNWHFSTNYKFNFQCFVYQSTKDDRRFGQKMSFKVKNLVVFFKLLNYIFVLRLGISSVLYMVPLA